MGQSQSKTIKLEAVSSERESLELRVARLENALAAIQDTQVMEDRLVERVVHRIEDRSPTNGTSSSSAGGILKAATRVLLPGPAEAAAVAFDVIPPETSQATEKRNGWFLPDLLGEIRTILRMYGDYRFRMSWTGRVVPLAAICVAMISMFTINIIPYFGWMLDRVVFALSIIVLYKALSREADRYQDFVSRIRYR